MRVNRVHKVYYAVGIADDGSLIPCDKPIADFYDIRAAETFIEEFKKDEKCLDLQFIIKRGTDYDPG